MFQSQKEGKEKRNKEGIVIGYDLGHQFAQISYCGLDEREPQTVSSVAGTEQYNIPALLCKRAGVGQWYYGREAVKFAQEEKGILVEDLLSLAERGEDVMVEGEAFDPVALLTLFVKRSLSLLNMRISLKQVEYLMFTVEELTPRMVDVLTRVAAGLSMKEKSICFQNHLESFYAYTMNQDRELRRQDVVIYEYHTLLKCLHLSCNERTSPMVVTIEKQEFERMPRRIFSEDEERRARQKEELDSLFLQIVEESLSGKQVSTVFLLGDGFKEGWAKESLKELCRNRRVFQGNNLYSKGACYGMLQRVQPVEEWKEHVYLGEDKLKANIGMQVLRRGEEAYYAILDAGANWYETISDFDIILEEEDTVTFVITPLTGGRVEQRKVQLPGLPERPRATTRLNIHIEMTAVDQATVTIEDRGFGELYPSSGKAWSSTLQL